jgi:RHS repeat-associated protein
VYRQSGQSWALVRTHRFYYDGWNLACESLTPAGSSEPAVFSRYLWGLDLAGQRDGKFGQAAGGIGGLLAVTVTSNGADRVCLPVSDAAGNIRKVVDASTGAVVAEYAYDPYGVPIETGGTASGACPFRYQTKYFDPETGLYYFGYRYYDPQSCKWLCRDPLQENGGVNLTAYCDNDPVNQYDPLGLAAYFFGGTGNNLDDDGWSNVELLYRAWDQNAGHGEAFYVPGVYSGYAPDGTPYKGWIKRPPISQGGYGASLQARADEMMKKQRTQLAAGDKEVNVFGFSRGSLTALVFLNMIAKEVEKGTDPLFKGITVNQTVLFDNVEHTWNDMPHDLPKNLNYTRQPMHLIAVDEQRDQFFDKDVLNIEGALQVGFRGVHANVGGGYDRDGLAAHSLRFVIQSMNACKMKVFRDAAVHRQMQKYGMLENGANRTPTDNDTWFYTMGTRVFPEGMFLAPTFRFNRTRLKNPMDVNAYDEFNSLHAEKWASGYKFIFGEGWVK